MPRVLDAAPLGPAYGLVLLDERPYGRPSSRRE